MKVSRRIHFLFLLGSAILAIVCALLIPKVNVNSDMTRYLPDASRMRKGIEIVTDEFGSTELTGADIRMMFHNLSEQREKNVCDSISAFESVESVSSRRSADGQWVLYEINAPDSIDQKTLGLKIRNIFEDEIIVETSQDGATAPVSVMIIAAVIILFILILMAQSWLEPYVFLFSAGIAVVLNTGTNALLPSVSITTNYIAAILQLVLSLDYSIVLMNRYRQEKHSGNNPVEAVNSAIRKAFPAIISSALTTVVGLLMLVFMRLKIGMDMGIVLAKGVLCSLLCTFTVLPSLLIICQKGVMATGKKTFILPTDRLSRFATSCKLPMAVLAVLFFCLSFYFSRKTEISFAIEQQSRIAEVFPRENPLVVVYDTDEESRINSLADSLDSIDGVKSIISYPTILQKQYTAEEMSANLKSMTASLGENMTSAVDSNLISADLLRLVYYMRYEDDASRKITFPDLLEFIREDCASNPLFADMIDDEMKEKLSLLDAYVAGGQEDDALDKNEEALKKPAEVNTHQESLPMLTEEKNKVEKTPEVKPETKPVKASESPAKLISLEDFLSRLYKQENSEVTAALYGISNRENNRKQMTAREMGDFIGSTPSQTKMVYSFSKSKTKTMSPLEYVHFLADDLFNRKSLASFVSAQQKTALLARRDVMDLIDTKAKLNAQEIIKLMRPFGINISESKIMSMMDASPASSVVVSAEPQVRLKDSTSVPSQSKDYTAAAGDSLAVAVKIDSVNTEIVVAAEPVAVPKKSIEEIRQELFMDMMYSGKAYTSKQMARNFVRLGEKIPENLISLLYVYYASAKAGADTSSDYTMSIEEIVSFIGDELLQDSRLKGFVDDSLSETYSHFRTSFEQGISMLRQEGHSIMLIMTALPAESKETYSFVDTVDSLCGSKLSSDYYLIGESAMYSEMKQGFKRELTVITLLTVLAIFIIIAISFRSVIVPLILVMTVMTAVYVNVIFSGIFSGSMLYIAYLIVQSILMGATIDYGILFTNYYRENRKVLPVNEAITASYKGFIRTIMTSGLIMIAGPGAMAVLVEDPAIKSIVGSLAIGSVVAVFLILVVVPGLLAVFDNMVVYGKRKKSL